jgi:hypothetical protein
MSAVLVQLALQWLVGYTNMSLIIYERLTECAVASPRSTLVIPAMLMLSALAVWVVMYTLRPHIERVLKPCCGSSPAVQDSLVTGDRSQRISAVGNTVARGMSMQMYIMQRLAIASLVLFFDNYDKAAQTALSMLVCVNVGAGPYPWRWVMDVRLPCPWIRTTTHASQHWQRAAAAVGILLLLVCICIPVLLATWLARCVYKGIITSPGKTEVPAFPESILLTRCGLSSRFRIFMRRSLCNLNVAELLRFRYDDYNIRYEQLRKPTADGGPLTAHNRGLASVPTGWSSSARKCWGRLSLRRLKLWAVLCWDSILDFHRLLLALAALCVMMHELHQLLLVVLVYSSYLVLILAARPYKCTTTWRLQVSALLVLLLSCFGIIACNIGDTSGFYEETTARDYMHVVPWVVISLNAAYISYAGYVLLRSVLAHCMAHCRHQGRVVNE